MVSRLELERRAVRQPRSGEVGIGSRPAMSPGDRNREYLIDLVSTYQESPRAQIVKDYRRLRNDEALSAFRKTALFSEAYAFASNRLDRFSNMDDFFPWFYGHMFSNVAWLQLASHVPDGFVVLPEADTVELSKEIGGLKTRANQAGSEMGVYQYIPDGVLVNKDGKILTAFEYTISTDYHKFITQSTGFRHFKNSIGEVAQDANLVFIVPFASREVLDGLKERLNGELRRNGYKAIGIEIDNLPFAYNEFSGLMFHLIRGYRSNDSSQTLAEMMEEREGMLNLALSKYNKRQELARQLEKAFGGDLESALYVIHHIVRRERPNPDPRRRL